MSYYEEPVVIANGDHAEGVFLASGSVGIDVRFEINTDGSGGTMLHAIFTNNGAEPYHLSKFVFTFDKNISFKTAAFKNNVSVSCNGNILTAEYVGPEIEGNGDSYTFIAHLNEDGITAPHYQINP